MGYMSIDAIIEVIAMDSIERESPERQAALVRLKEACCAYSYAVRACADSDQLSRVSTLFAREMAQAEEDMCEAQ